MRPRRLLNTSIFIALASLCGTAKAQAIGGDLTTQNLASYWDPHLGTENVFYLDTSGQIDVLTYPTPTGWAWKQATSYSGFAYAGGPITAYYSPTQGKGHLFFTGSNQGSLPNGTLWDMSGTPPTCFQSCAATGSTITALSYAAYPQESAPIPFVDLEQCGSVAGKQNCNRSNLTGFDNGDLHLFYAAAMAQDPSFADTLVEVYYNEGNWFWHSISTDQNAAPHSLNSLWDGSVEHVFYTDYGSGSLHETYYNGNWFSHIVTPDIAAFMDLSSISVASGQESVMGSPQYNTGSGEWVWWADHGTGWYSGTSSPSPQIQWISPTLVYEMGSYGTGMFYVGLDQHIYQQVQSTYVDITANTGAARAGGTVSSLYEIVYGLVNITGFYDGYNAHVFFVGIDGNIWEIYGQGSANGWTAHDITPAGEAHDAVAD